MALTPIRKNRMTSVCSAPNVDVIFLREACKIAAHESEDARTQNGALLRAPNGVFVTAANRFPIGVVSSLERQEATAKKHYIEHAERGAIFAAARAGIKTAGATLYCPWFACSDCARAIICAGITEIVGHTKPRIYTPDRWKESIEIADGMLAEAGVKCRLIDDELGVRYLFNGEWFDI